MKTCIFGLCSMVMLAGIPGTASATLIHFDDRAGMNPPLSQGLPVALEYLVDDEYLSEGVLFNAGGGGIAICAGSNAISPRNAAAGTSTGPILDFYEPIYASFCADGSTPAIVDTVSITLTSTSTSSVLNAYDYYGRFLGSTYGGTSKTLTVSYTGLIHSVIISPHYAAFDNLTFEGLTSIPEPGMVCLLGMGGVVMVKRGKKDRYPPARE